MSRMDPILPPERARAMRAAGLWPDRLITDYFDEAAATKPNQLAVADHNSMTGRPSRLTYRELAERVDRMAVGLAKLGVEAGDVVAFQLPNWWQFVALYLACVRIGAVGNPLMPIFRARELKFMLGFAEAKVMVVPRTFGNHDYAAMMEDLRKELPALQHVLVVDDSPQGSFE